MNQIQLLKPKTAVEKKTRTVVDTIMVTPESINKWLSPSFQRPVKENEKVRALAEALKQDGGVLPGIITLGVLDGETYIIDGQHRRSAFLLSGLKEGFTDIRKHFFSDISEMGEEFVNLNSQLVRMRPDDILRGLEGSHAGLSEIRRACPFVGYDMIRRNDTVAPIVSMSGVLRQWFGSSMESPSAANSGRSTVQLASIGEEDVKHLCDFLTLAMEAFGRDPEHFRLWGALNMTLCMWLYRNTVIKQYSPRSIKMSKDHFMKCLMYLAAEARYSDWLVGRKMGDRDRTPAYTRVKVIFSKRLTDLMGARVALPQPPWAGNVGGKTFRELAAKA